MKLPLRGCLVNPDGTIAWAWEHNDPTRDFESLPPLIVDFATGVNRFVADPAAVVLSLEAVTKAGDMQALYHDMNEARARIGPTGKWQLTKIIRTPGKADREIPHPLESLINAQPLVVR